MGLPYISCSSIGSGVSSLSLSEFKEEEDSNGSSYVDDACRLANISGIGWVLLCTPGCFRLVGRSVRTVGFKFCISAIWKGLWP